VRITYFHWSKTNNYSIVKSFRPLIDELKKEHEIREFHVPYAGASPINLLRNIIFVMKNRDNRGVNHITGDIHYCILGLIGCQSVLTIHDDYAIVKAKRGLLDKIYKWFFWLYLPIKFATKVICISNSTKSRIDRLVSNKKTQVLTQNSFNSNFKFSLKAFNTDYPRILQIGTSEQKNLESTLKAIENIPCELRVVKKMSNSQHQLAKSLNIHYSNIYDISDDDIIKEYIQADIIVFPSLYEGFGMPIIEAQAVGRPVITSDRPPMNWVAADGALLLDDPQNTEEYKSKILSLIQSERLRKELIDYGQINIKRFEVSSIYTHFVEFYQKLI